jgi:hypothetical protein
MARRTAAAADSLAVMMASQVPHRGCHSDRTCVRAADYAGFCGAGPLLYSEMHAPMMIRPIQIPGGW